MSVAPTTLFEKIWRRHVVHERDDGQHAAVRRPPSACRTARRPAFADAAPARPRAARAGARVRHARPLRADRQPQSRGRRATPKRRAMAQALARRHRRRPASASSASTIRARASCTSSGPSRACRSRACSSSAATATRRRTARSARSRSASARREVAHVLATQTLWQRKPRTLRITVDGELAAGVSRQGHHPRDHREDRRRGRRRPCDRVRRADDARAVDGRPASRVCNMSIEAGARAGMIAPDDTTFAYLAGRPFAPAGPTGSARWRDWRTLRTRRRRDVRPRGDARRRRDSRRW